MEHEWPPHPTEHVQWEVQTTRGAKLGESDVGIPNEIAEFPVYADSPSAREAAINAEQRLLRRDVPNGLGGTMEGLLLRTEAVNSSRIEGISTSVRNLCLAAAGAASRPGAEETVRNFTSLRRLLENPNPITEQTVKSDHAQIMANKPFAGKYREDIAWVGGATPADSVRVVAMPEHIPRLMADAIRFANRQDVGIVEKVALLHCQFECIHPFADGNGRTGRALTQRVLVATGYRAVPVSAALLAVSEHYYSTFAEYIQGNVSHPIEVHALCLAAATAAINAHLADRDQLLEDWHARAGIPPNSTKSMALALRWMTGTPAFAPQEMADALQVSHKTATRLLATLEEADIATRSRRAMPNSPHGNVILWETPEVYDLAERVENTAAQIAQREVRTVGMVGQTGGDIAILTRG